MGELKNTPAMEKKSSKRKITIIILIVLLLFSSGGLAARLIYLNLFAAPHTTVTVPDNLIGDKENVPEESKSEVLMESGLSLPEDSQNVVEIPKENHMAKPAARPVASHTADNAHKATKLELFKGQSGDNERFETHNMFPGDRERKYFCVKVSHDADVTLLFRTDVTEQTKKLGDVLHIQVKQLETGDVICDAPFSEVNGKEFATVLPKNAEEETVAYYRVDVLLDTSVGNEYQAAMLKANFSWSVKEDDHLVTSPQTGDSVNGMLEIVIAVSALLLIALLQLKQRGEDKSYEATK